MTDGDANDDKRVYLDLNQVAALANILKAPGRIGYLTFIVAILALITSGVQTYIYLRSLQVGQSQQSATIEQLQIARLQSSSTQNQDKRESRAYIGVNNIYVDQFVPPNRLRFNLETKNFGKSKATHVEVTSFHDVFDEVANEQFPLRGVEEWNNSNGGNVFQENLYTVDFNVELTPAELDRFTHVGSSVLFYGKIEYFDVFGEKHYTKFCGQFDRDYTRALMVTKGFKNFNSNYFCIGNNDGD